MDRTGQDRTGQDRTGQDRTNSALKVVIYAREPESLEIEHCLRENVELRAVVIAVPYLEYDSSDTVEELRAVLDERTFVLVENQLVRLYLSNQNIPDEKILVFHTRHPSRAFFKVFHWRRWLYACGRYFLLHKSGKIFSGLKNKIKVLNDTKSLHFYDDRREIIFVGESAYQKFGLESLRRQLGEKWKVLPFKDEEEVTASRRTVNRISFEELLYMDLKDVWFYIMDTKNTGEGFNTAERLFGLGVRPRQMFSFNGKIASLGSKRMDAFDPLLGFARIGMETPGFVRFANCDAPDFCLATLGGSTSDPTWGNIKSWSEYLYLALADMGYKIELFAGGVGGYRSAQECLKLLKDTLLIAPDMVISYSGYNDGWSRTLDTEPHPFIRPYMKEFYEFLISKKKIKEPRHGTLIETVSMGMADPRSRAQFWISAERSMHGLCREFGIDFLGLLQPYNDKFFDEPSISESEEAFFREARRRVEDFNAEWLVDFSHIFDGESNIYTDNCHVFEKGNRIIARKVLPYVLRAMEEKRRKKGEGE